MSQIANKEEYTSLLKQRLNNLVELNRQCLRNYEEKISLLVQDRAFLKREYDMINLNLKERLMSPSQIQLSKKSNLKRFGSKDLAQIFYSDFFGIFAF